MLSCSPDSQGLKVCGGLGSWVIQNGGDSPSWAALGCWGSPELSPDWQQPRAGDRDGGVLGHLSFWRVSAGACACAGATCEDVLAPCAGSPCKNGGECQESEDYKSFSCSCPPGWQGMDMALLGLEPPAPLREGKAQGKERGLGEGPDLPHGSAGWMGHNHCLHPLASTLV